MSLLLRIILESMSRARILFFFCLEGWKKVKYGYGALVVFFSFGAYKCYIFSSSVCVYVLVCSGVFRYLSILKKKINKTAFLLFWSHFFLFRVNYFRYHTNTFISPSAPAEATYPFLEVFNFCFKINK